MIPIGQELHGPLCVSFLPHSHGNFITVFHIRVEYRSVIAVCNQDSGGLVQWIGRVEKALRAERVNGMEVERFLDCSSRKGS